jgi:hypothetical protein
MWLCRFIFCGKANEPMSHPEISNFRMWIDRIIK